MLTKIFKNCFGKTKTNDAENIINKYPSSTFNNNKSKVTLKWKPFHKNTCKYVLCSTYCMKNGNMWKETELCSKYYKNIPWLRAINVH